MKQRHFRVGDDLSDDVTVVVGGGELEPVLLRDDALRNFAIYGTYGISVFALRDVTLDELAQLPPLVRFEQLTLMTVGAYAWPVFGWTRPAATLTTTTCPSTTWMTA